MYLLEPPSEQMVTYTAEDAIEELGFGCYQWKVMLLCCAFPVWLLMCCSFMMAKSYIISIRSYCCTQYEWLLLWQCDNIIIHGQPQFWGPRKFFVAKNIFWWGQLLMLLCILYNDSC